jgi:hypothetical protein
MLQMSQQWIVFVSHSLTKKNTTMKKNIMVLHTVDFIKNGNGNTVPAYSGRIYHIAEQKNYYFSTPYIAAYSREHSALILNGINCTGEALAEIQELILYRSGALPSTVAEFITARFNCPVIKF